METEKPKYNPKYLLVDMVFGKMRRISFYADEETADSLREYGEVSRIQGDRYSLIVLGGYDFDEVLDYIKQ